MSGADLEYQRMLQMAGVPQPSSAGYDGARLEQLGDESGPDNIIAAQIEDTTSETRAAIETVFAEEISDVADPEQVADYLAEQAALEVTQAGEASIAEMEALKNETKGYAEDVEEMIAGSGGVQVTWSGLTATQIATIQGYWIIVSTTAPAETTKYGVPGIWIDQTEALVPTPVNATSPTFNSNNQTFTIPSGIIGVDYIWTSGGGGVGATLVQGTTYTTSGAYPREVVITAVPKPGYTMLGQIEFRHTYADPAVVTLLTTENFTGAAVELIGRTTDCGSGGGPFVWVNVSNNTTAQNQWKIDGSGSLTYTPAGSWLTGGERWARLFFPGVQNVRIEFDIVSFTNAGAFTFGVEAGLQTMELSASSGTFKSTFATDVINVPSLAMATGHWSMQIVNQTTTIKNPAGVDYNFTYMGAVAPLIPTRIAFIRSNSSAATLVLDNVKISKLGI